MLSGLPFLGIGNIFLIRAWFSFVEIIPPVYRFPWLPASASGVLSFPLSWATYEDGIGIHMEEFS